MWISTAQIGGNTLINLDRVARIDYYPEHMGSIDEDETPNQKVQARLHIYFAVPEITINSYGDSSSDGQTSLLEQRFHGSTAAELWRQIQNKT